MGQRLQREKFDRDIQALNYTHIERIVKGALLHSTPANKSGYQYVSRTLFLRYDNVSRQRSPDVYLERILYVPLTLHMGMLLHSLHVTFC